MTITLAYNCLFILLLILINFLDQIFTFNLVSRPKFLAPPLISTNLARSLLDLAKISIFTNCFAPTHFNTQVYFSYCLPPQQTTQFFHPTLLTDQRPFCIVTIRQPQTYLQIQSVTKEQNIENWVFTLLERKFKMEQ